MADVPLPLAIPYGFFPFTKSYSSGFIMPTYGDESSRGFYLRDGGYYFAMSDKWDLKLLGEIYTKGSWGVSVASNYRKRYKYSGSFLFSYQNTKNGDKGMPDYSEQTSFSCNGATARTKGQPVHQPVGKRQLRVDLIRAQQSYQHVQSAELHAEPAHIKRKLEQHILKHRHDAQRYGQPQPEHD